MAPEHFSGSSKLRQKHWERADIVDLGALTATISAVSILGVGNLLQLSKVCETEINDHTRGNLKKPNVK